MYWVDRLDPKTPILILHGGSDEAVNPDFPEALAQRLDEFGHPHKLVIYPGDNHGMRAHHQEVLSELSQCLKKYFAGG